MACLRTFWRRGGCKVIWLTQEMSLDNACKRAVADGRCQGVVSNARGIGLRVFKEHAVNVAWEVLGEGAAQRLQQKVYRISGVPVEWGHANMCALLRDMGWERRWPLDNSIGRDKMRKSPSRAGPDMIPRDNSPRLQIPEGSSARECTSVPWAASPPRCRSNRHRMGRSWQWPPLSGSTRLLCTACSRWRPGCSTAWPGIVPAGRGSARRRWCSSAPRGTARCHGRRQPGSRSAKRTHS